jgi:chemotaxis protein methyltransferase CheR
VPVLPLSPQVFAILSALVMERAGLSFDGTQASIFADKVSARAGDAGFESLLDYYYYLRYDEAGSAELDRLIEALVVGETYLFRELGPLEAALREVVMPRVAEGWRPRVWCAASATGEEAHTFAMLLASQGALESVDLVASDINATSLARAASGRLGRRALRGVIPSFAERWVAVEGNEIVVDPRITAAIDWRRVNLMDHAAVATQGTFDVILCRNVLIYFSDETVRRVVDRLSQRLRPNGALLVGISESLLRFETALHCEERRGAFLYRRRP